MVDHKLTREDDYLSDFENINKFLFEDLSKELLRTYRLIKKSDIVLSLDFIFKKLVEEKLVDGSISSETDFWYKINFHRELFTTCYSFNKTAIGLKENIPLIKRPKRRKKFLNVAPTLVNNILNGLSVVKNNKILRYQHKLSQEEIDESYLILSKDLLALFSAYGEGFQLNIYCYADYSFNAWVNPKFTTLHSPGLKKFYQDNKLKLDDIIFTEKRIDDPTGIHLFTTWQIDQPDLKEKNHEQRKKEVKVEDEKEIDKETLPVVEINKPDPVYLLSLIQKNDDVYKYLKLNNPSSVLDILNAISKKYGIQKSEIERLSIIDFLDVRIVRSPDGKIALKESDLEIVKIETTQSNSEKGRKFINFVIIGTVSLIILLIFIILLFKN